MSQNDVFLTPEGVEKLRAELEHLKQVKRPELSRRLREAIAMGDLSENADYIASKEEQAFLEGKIQELEATLRAAKIIEQRAPSGRVELGSVVRVAEAGEPPQDYRIVGAKEADPRNGRISNESPLGKALLGKKPGETATAQTPGGEIIYQVIAIIEG